MSGHSKWSTIKHQKAVNDAARGNLFSKLSRAITIAAKGGPDPDMNFKLRVVIDKAKEANMPKDNIERAISKAQDSGDLEEISYEGFGPFGIAVIVEVATDNRNRTAQEIKNLFERGGGSLAGPGAVAFNFEPKGLLLVKKSGNVDEQILNLIDLGVEDVEETEDGIEAYVSPNSLSNMKEKVGDKGYKIVTAELIQKPKSYQKLVDPVQAKKAVAFLEKLEEQDDVQKVFANLDVPDEVLEKK